MKKELPKIKKSLKSFILEEDAKIIDKSGSKIAIAAAMIASGALSVQDANAGWFSKHYNHTNHANHVLDHVSNPELLNTGNVTKTETISLSIKCGGEGGADKAQSTTIDVPPKSVSSAHANHKNTVSTEEYTINPFGYEEC